MPSNIQENLSRVRASIQDALARSHRPLDSVRLVAVTKTVSADRVAEAAAAGVTDFGENYVQEARDKIFDYNLRYIYEVAWHFIGHLQSNKAKYSVDLFSLIHSVDNYQLAQEIGKQATKRGKTQPILIEVNLAEDPKRAGTAPKDALILAERIAPIPGIELQGLMGMAPFGEKAEAARPYFAELRRLFDGLPPESQRVLSMGMSGDFEIAIEEGATLVRVGTALFGKRGE